MIDPEAGRSHRANLEWGEVPSKLVSDVAEVTFLEEECAVAVTPGAQPKGVLFVLGPGQATTGSLVYMRDGVEVTKALASDLKPIGSPASKETFFRVGTLFLATDSEAAHLASVRDPDAIRALRALGYVE